MIEDAQLLRRYVEVGSEAAFAELVGRRIGLVYSVALRTTRDTHRAEDVTQTVFADLARKATSLANRPVLAGWLYRSAHFAALGAVRAERNRTTREQEAQTMQEILGSDGPGSEWEKVRPVLDQVMSELNERDRDAIMLRYFDGRPFADIGARLQLTENSARMRVERALDKLHALLAERGVTSTSAVLAAVLANQAAATVPAGLAASVAGSALTKAAATVAGAGGLTALWTLMSASKITVSLAAAGALAIATAVYQSGQARTAAASLAAAGKENATARARLADLESKVRTAEHALADRAQAAAQAAANAALKPRPAAGAAGGEAAKYLKALQEFLDHHAQLRMLKEEASQAYKRANHWPFFFGIGLTPEQAERAQTLVEESWARRKAQFDAGLNPPRDDSQFRAAFGDAATERWVEFNNVRWDTGRVVYDLAAGLYFADEPFTAQQQARLLEILKGAKTTEDWGRVLAQAEPVLSPAQMRGLRAQAGSVRMNQMRAAATKEAAAATNK